MKFRKYTHWIALVGAAATFAATLVGIDAPRAETRGSVSGAMDLPAAYSAAIVRSELLAGQLELVNQAEERARQALAGVLPTVGFTASRLWQQEVSGVGNAIFPATQDNVRLSATQPLFRGFREFAALRQARRLAESQDFSRRQAEIQLYQDVAQSLYLVLSLEKEADDIRRELAVYEKRIGELRSRMRIGRSRESEVLTVEASLATLRAQLESMMGQIAGARQLLAFLTGKPAEIPVVDSEPGVTPDHPELAIDRLLAEIERRPDVLAAREARDAADSGRTVAWGAHLPSLDLNGNYYFIRPGSLADSHWDVQVLLTLPLFAGDITQSRSREANSLFTQADLAYTRAQRQAEQQIRTLHATYLADATQLQSLIAAADLNERNSQVQHREYRLGMATNLDVLQALGAAVESLRARDRVQFGLKLDRIRLEGAAAIRPQTHSKTEPRS